MKVYDISPEISEQIAVFPGDTAFSRHQLMSIKDSHIELSSIATTVHLGAHADAPLHYHVDGESIESRSLNYYLGLCQVLSVDLKPNQSVLLEHINKVKIQAPRVLFKTNSFLNPNKWNNNFNSLSESLIEYLHTQNVMTVGLDTPSIDPAESKDLKAHQSIYKNNMAVLEGLVLKDVPDGFYELVALPLKLKGCDASPVRAILRELPK